MGDITTLVNKFDNSEEHLIHVQVQDQYIPVKKKVLLKLPYFANMFRGDWRENQLNSVTLHCAFETATFMLNHISASPVEANPIPPTLILTDLIGLADMLAFDELLTLTSTHLKQKLFHAFHKPCSECITAILHYLPILTTYYSLSNLERESLDWISRHFKVTWPTQSFAELAIPSQQRCLNRKISELRAENVLDTIIGCNVISGSLPSVKWARAIADITQQLKDSSHVYLSSNLLSVLHAPKFHRLEESGEMDLSRLDSVLLRACQEAEVDEACESLSYLQKWPSSEFETPFTRFAEKLIEVLKKNLTQHVMKARACPKWAKLTPEIQQSLLQSALFLPWEENGTERPRIVKLPACLTKPTLPKPRPSSMPTTRNATSNPAPGTKPAHNSQMPRGRPTSATNASQTQRNSPSPANPTPYRSASANKNGNSKPSVWK